MQSLITSYSLEQNYPNPFNLSTKINYSILSAGDVRLSVFNMLGEEIKVFINSFLQAGNYELTLNAQELSSGIYVYRLMTNGNILSKKMILLK